MADQNKNPTIGSYLLDRLHAFGVEHIFGVPGDYVLRLDKLIEKHPHIRFINSTQESCAGYAADAYARMNGLGAACITYGVGISITNALAQAFVENSPMVVISGAVSQEEFLKHSSLHHLINKSSSINSDTTQLEIFKQVTIDQGVLNDPETAGEIIDRVLDSCINLKKPVYFELPRNLVDTPITINNKQQKNHFIKDEKALKEALDETVQLLKTSQTPLIWAGHEILRFGLGKELLKFAEKYQIPVVSSLLGKTVIDEHHPLFAGVYQGGMSQKEIIDLVHNCDCALILGVLINDIETGIFTAKVEHEKRIMANVRSINIGHHHYHDVPLKDYLEGLSKINFDLKFSSSHIPRRTKLPSSFKPNPKTKTTTKRVFECIQNHINSSHIVMTDVGDCLFASADLILPYNSFIACAYFASLGFGVPGAIGAQFARPDKRVIAIVGDGGFQMTAMELSAAVRYHQNIIVIVLNNHGYGTERPLLEGTYNDILDWNYTAIPTVLGGGKGIKVTNEEELSSGLNEAFGKKDQFYLIEIDLDKLDFSPALKRLGELLGGVVKK